jgi:hypothetical protein
MDPSNPAVMRILECAARLTAEEVRQLDAAVRRRPGLVLEAYRVLEEHQRFLNATAMFDHWPDPALEMAEARRRVAAALGEVPDRAFRPVEHDDGTALWGAATAAACAVLGSGRASSMKALRAAWEDVIAHDLHRRLQRQEG